MIEIAKEIKKPSIKIGCVRIDPPIILAPMAGITNHSFRALCKQYGAGAVYTEMISSYGIHYNNHRTTEMFDWTDDERPVIAQLFGGDPAIMAEAARKLQSAGADIVDINVGCPVPKVRKSGAGTELLKDYHNLELIISSVVRAVDIPVTIKTRKGLDSNRTTAIEVAKIAQDCGAAAIAIHGRTAVQGYSGNADWNIIKQVKGSVDIPVIGNGDIRSPEDARRMFEETGCDAVMIGRGALGNPWIFSNTMHFLESGEPTPEPALADRVEAALRHLALTINLHGETRGVREMRGQLGWYIKNVPGAAHIRHLLTQASTASDMQAALEHLLKLRHWE